MDNGNDFKQVELTLKSHYNFLALTKDDVTSLAPHDIQWSGVLQVTFQRLLYP